MPKTVESKTIQWKTIIENWDLKETNALMDATLRQVNIANGSNSMVNRRAILFPTVLCLCKSISNEKWKLKEKILLTKFNVYDKSSVNPEHEHMFEIQTSEKYSLFTVTSEEEKLRWLTLLIFLRNKQ